MKKYIRERSEQVILSVMNQLSSALYELPIDDGDFKMGAWIPLNINHENVVVKYIARSVTKFPAAPLKPFIEDFALQVTTELTADFRTYYTKDPVGAHNTAIIVSRELTRLKTFVEILIQMDEDLEVEVLTKWLAINMVEIAEDDWR